jgi:hypothetical protein
VATMAFGQDVVGPSVTVLEPGPTSHAGLWAHQTSQHPLGLSRRRSDKYQAEAGRKKVRTQQQLAGRKYHQE